MRRLLLVGASALLLAGCAGSDGGSTQDAASATAAPGGTDMTAYAACMAEHGVDLPTGGGPMGGTPPSGMPSDRPSGMPSDLPTDVPSGMPGRGPGSEQGAPPGVAAETWQAAQAACSDVAPSGRPGQPGADPPSAGAQYSVFWTCMSDHDVTAPASGLPADLDEEDETVAAALAICDALLPDQTNS